MASTVYVTDSSGTQQFLQIGVSGTLTDFISPGQTGNWNWAVEKFGYGRLTGTFTPGTGGVFSNNLDFLRDYSITQTTQATVAAYTVISNYDQLYDYAAYIRTQIPNYVLASGSNGTITFNCNLVFNSAASSLWSYNSTTNTLTVKTTTVLATGVTNTNLVTTGTITETNVTITGQYSSPSGPSSVINFTNLTSAAILLLNNSSVQVDNQKNKSGTYSEYLAPGSTGKYTWVAEQYGSNRQTGTLDLTLGGTFAPLSTWVADSNITIINSATVAAYSSISNVDQLYDYSAYMRTQDPTYQLLTAFNGTVYASCNLVFNTSASTMWSYNSTTNTLTVKTAATLASGINNTTISTTGTITVNNSIVTALYTNSVGNSSRLNYSGLISSTVMLIDNTNVIQDTGLNKTGTYVEYIPPTATGNWNWYIARYGYLLQNSSVQWTGGGDFTALVNYVSDSNITQSNSATVAAYTVFSNLDQVYDYAKYMETLQPNLTLATGVGSKVVFNCNLIVDENATSIWSYNSATNTLTIKATLLVKGVKFTTLSVSTLTINNSASLTCLYISNLGSSSDLNFSNLTQTTLYVTDNSSSVFNKQINLSTDTVIPIPPTATGNWNWTAYKYGNVPQTAQFVPIGGDINVALAYVSDTNISNQSQALVAAYTVFSNLDQVYDYAKYMETLQPENIISTANGNILQINAAIVVDENATGIWNYNSTTNTLTIKATTLASGVNFSTIKAMGTNTITTANSAVLHCLYADSTGSSDRINFINLNNNSTVYIFTQPDVNTTVDFDVKFNLSGNFTEYLNQQQTLASVGNYTWVVTNYGNIRQTGSFNPVNANDITPAISFLPDTAITTTSLTEIEALTEIDTLDQFYDYGKYMETVEPQYVLTSKVGNNVLFDPSALILDPNATSIWNYDHSTSTLTIKSSILGTGSKFTGLNVSGGVTLNNNAQITVPYTGSAGPSASLVFTGLNNSSIYISDNNGNVVLFLDNLTNGYTKFFEPGLTGTYSWVVTRYGYLPITGTFTPGTGGAFTATCTWVLDNSITVPVEATVAAYTTLDTAAEIYDYGVYYTTTNAGIVFGNVMSMTGNQINFGNYNILLDSNAVAPFSISGNLITIKTNELTANIVTKGLITYANGAIINGIAADSTGFTSQLIITNLLNCSLAILDDTGNIYAFTSNISGDYVLNLDGSKTGKWAIIATKFGFKTMTSSFTLRSGLVNTVNYSSGVDPGVTVTDMSTVAAYTELDTTKKMYDYFSLWATTEAGILYYAVTAWSGSVLNIGNANLTLDPTYPVDLAATMDPTTLMVHIKCSNLSGDLITSGTVYRNNGATTSGLVTDATGTTSIINFGPLEVGDTYYIEDINKGSVQYGTSTGTSVTFYLLPSQQVAGNWNWSVKRLRYTSTSGNFNPTGGGIINITPQFIRIAQGDGTTMYTGSTATGISVDWTTSGNGTPRIVLGNSAFGVQVIYDTVERALLTQSGMQWLAEGGSVIAIQVLAAGSFIFLGAGWEFICLNNTCYNAAINGFAESTNGTVVDGTNGPIAQISASGLPANLTDAILNTNSTLAAIAESYATNSNVLAFLTALK